jgi:membrane protein
VLEEIPVIISGSPLTGASSIYHLSISRKGAIDAWRSNCNINVAVANLPASEEAHPTRDVLRHIRKFSRLRAQEIGTLLKQTGASWFGDKAPRLAAALAFYTLLSLAPLVVVVVAVAAFAFGEKAAQGQLVWEIRDLVGAEGAKAIQELIQSAYKPGTGVFATVLGVITLGFGASSVAVELRDALNTIWGAPATGTSLGFRGILTLAKERFYSFGLVLAIGFLLLVSLLLNTAIAAIGSFYSSILPASESCLQGTIALTTFLIATLLFAAIYKFLPDVQLRWSDVIVGAAFTSLLFTAGKQLIGMYLGKASFGSTYGAAGSLVIVLVWVYYSAQLFFFGAEFTKIYTRTFGSHFTAQIHPHPPTPGNAIVNPATGLPASQPNPCPKVELS